MGEKTRNPQAALPLMGTRGGGTEDSGGVDGSGRQGDLHNVNTGETLDVNTLFTIARQRFWEIIHRTGFYDRWEEYLMVLFKFD